jgi:PST family polysaccharide transporter
MAVPFPVEAAAPGRVREAADDCPHGALGASSLRAVGWLTLSSLARVALVAVVPVSVARLAGPQELGLVELTWGIYLVCSPLVDLGTGPLVVQHRDGSERILSAVFVLNAATAVALVGGLGVAAPAITWALGADDRLTLAVRVVGVVCAAFALGVVPGNLLARDMRFKAISVIAIGSTILAIVTGLVAMATGAGLPGLAAAGAIYLLGPTLVKWLVAGWRPTVRPSGADHAHAARFGLTTVGAAFVNNVATQLERFLVSSALGPAAVGQMSAANTLVRTPFRSLMEITDGVLLPGLASVQDNLPRARAYYLRAVQCELALLLPGIAAAAVFAPELSALAFGPQFPMPAPLVWGMAGVAAQTVTNHSIGAVFLSQGRPDVQLRWSALSVPLMVVTVAAGLPWGLAGVAASLATAGLAGWWISHAMANRLIGLSMRGFLGAACGPTLAGLAALAMTFGVRALCLAVGVSPLLVGLPAALLSVLPAYFIVLHHVRPDLARAVWQALLDRSGA